MVFRRFDNPTIRPRNCSERPFPAMSMPRLTRRKMPSEICGNPCEGAKP